MIPNVTMISDYHNSFKFEKQLYEYLFRILTILPLLVDQKGFTMEFTTREMKLPQRQQTVIASTRILMLHAFFCSNR